MCYRSDPGSGSAPMLPLLGNGVGGCYLTHVKSLNRGTALRLFGVRLWVGLWSAMRSTVSDAVRSTVLASPAPSATASTTSFY